jgi:hypothetical protein
MSKKKLRFPKADRSVCHKDGSEKICSKPTELRAKLNAPVTLRQKMQSLWKEFREREEDFRSQESIQDAQDFDIDEGNLPPTPYECEGEMVDHLELDETVGTLPADNTNEGETNAEDSSNDSEEQGN